MIPTNGPYALPPRLRQVDSTTAPPANPLQASAEPATESQPLLCDRVLGPRCGTPVATPTRECMQCNLRRRRRSRRCNSLGRVCTTTLSWRSPSTTCSSSARTEHCPRLTLPVPCNSTESTQSHRLSTPIKSTLCLAYVEFATESVPSLLPSPHRGPTVRIVSLVSYPRSSKHVPSARITPLRARRYGVIGEQTLQRDCSEWSSLYVGRPESTVHQRVCVCACARACVRACVHACVRAC